MASSSLSQPAAKGPKPTPAASAKAPKGGAATPPAKESYRETVEAIAVAFILALLVRGFEAEAFVIPTGSMAPTLMGRHKEVTCPECGYVYTVNASDEVEGYSGAGDAMRRVATGICGNCRYQARVSNLPSFKGDRILVMKFPYDLPFLPGASDPRRWDVIVFRYPEEPEISYIKRLVGLPGETLRIWRGDIFIKAPGGSEFLQEHRPLEHQSAMQMMVYDDRLRAKSLKDRPEWQRWQSRGPGLWKEQTEGQTPGVYLAAPTDGEWAEIRYGHRIPDPVQWRAIESGDSELRPPRPTLITDFYSYNTNLNVDNSDLTIEPRGLHSSPWQNAWLQPHWVGDLTLSGKVTTKGSPGTLRLELIEGGVSNRCEIDLASGEATLTHGDTVLGRKPSPLKAAGVHDVVFANVDNRLTLLVDGDRPFDDGLTYDDEPDNPPAPTADDLEPARIAAKGAAVQVSDLVLKRDIYYTLYPGNIDYPSTWEARLPRTPVELFDLLADPARVAALGPLGMQEFEIGADRFLMLGDNSPRSKDSRGWSRGDQYFPADPENQIPERGWDTSGRQKWEVPRAMLTGKAFCVYWPHGKPFGPDIKLTPDFRIPFRPYFERMKWIH